MVGLQTVPLEQAEPDFDLIEPGGIRGKPQDLEMQAKIADAFQLLEPAFELLGSMSRAVIKDEKDRVNLSAQGLRKNGLLDKALEIDKAFARAAASVDHAIRDGKPGKQVSRPATMVTGFVKRWFAWTSGARWLLPFTGLDGRFFIQAQQSGAAWQKRLRLKVGVENGARALQEGLWMMDMLPGMVAPRAEAFRFEPATYRTRGELW